MTSDTKLETFEHHSNNNMIKFIPEMHYDKLAKKPDDELQSTMKSDLI